MFIAAMMQETLIAGGMRLRTLRVTWSVCCPW